jgi:hypothetical protein
VAALVYIFSRRDRPKFIAMAIMGLGMVFFGLELMKDGFAPMKDIPAFVEAFAWFRADTYLGVLKCVLVGCVLTFLVQSSSATLASPSAGGHRGHPLHHGRGPRPGREHRDHHHGAPRVHRGEHQREADGLRPRPLQPLRVLWITLIFQWYVRWWRGSSRGCTGPTP